MGEDVGLGVYLGAGWSLNAGAMIGPHLGGRLALYTGLFTSDDFSLSFGLRGLVVPLPDGTAFGGGAGLRLRYSLISHVSLVGWFAVEAYKTHTETLVEPLLTFGMQLNL